VGSFYRQVGAGHAISTSARRGLESTPAAIPVIRCDQPTVPAGLG